MIHASAQARRHTLRGDGLDRESLVWDAPVPSAGLPVVVYTWVDGRHRAGTAAMALARVRARRAGQRDQSWGRRDWAAMTHMKWFNVMSGAAAVHLVELQAFGRTFLRGYVVRGSDVSPIADADLRPDFDSRLMYEHAWCRVTDGRTLPFELDGDPHAFVWQVHPRLRLHDSLLTGTLDGSLASAYADASWETCYVDYHQALAKT